MHDRSISSNASLQSKQTPEVETVRTFYNKNSINFSRMVPDAVARYHNLSLAARMGIQPGHYIFDAGCGAGIPAIHIAQSFPGTRIEGITISEVEAAEAQIRIAQANLVDRVRVQVGDFHASPFPDGIFDVVFFNDSIKYSNRLPRVLSEVKRLLRPGGTLYITGLFVKEPPLSPLEQQVFIEFQQSLPGSHIITHDKTIEYVRQAGFQAIESDKDQTINMPILGYRLASANLIHPHLPLFFGDIKAVKPAKVKVQPQKPRPVVASGNFGDRHEENLRCIEEHKQIFDIQTSDLLHLFEKFVGKQRQNKGGSISCCCNIENDRLYPARFYYLSEAFVPDPAIRLLDIEDFLAFSREIEARPELQLNFGLLQQFLDTGLDPSKLDMVSVAVDVRSELRNSRIKLYFNIRDYPEKTAIATALCGEHRRWEKLIVNGTLLVGFDFFLDNRAAVEVYPTFYPNDLQRPEVQEYLAEILPDRAFDLVKETQVLQIGISSENDSDVIYFCMVKSPNCFIDDLGNQMVKQVHDRYRNRAFHGLYIGVPQSEFDASSIQRVKMYYQMNNYVNVN